MKRKLLLLGGGGHCRSILDSVRALEIYDEIALVDKSNADVRGLLLLGNDDALPCLLSEGWTEAFISVGSTGNTDVRRRLYRELKDIGFTIPTIVDPSAVIASDVYVGEGVYVAKRAVINAGSSVGACAIINTAAVVEHDCSIGDFAHISPGAVLCGEVIVGSDAHIGAGSVVRQQLTVGAGSLVGIGSVVVSDVPEGVTAYGTPCRVFKK